MAEHNEESLMEKIANKIHFDHSSSSSSDSDSAVKPTVAPVKARIWRLFGRKEPVHHVLGGGKRFSICSTKSWSSPLPIIRKVNFAKTIAAEIWECKLRAYRDHS